MKYFELLYTFLRLGLTSFGGPIAHLSFFHNEFVKKKKWITDQMYSDLVTLCQFLPGPASSQVGMAIGMFRGGIWGAIIAWLGFTLPSALILILFGLGITKIDLASHYHWIHGLKVVSVAVVFQAVLSMSKQLYYDWKRMVIAILSALIILFFHFPVTQFLVLIGAGFLSIFILKSNRALPHDRMHLGYRKTGYFFLITFTMLLIALPIARSLFNNQILNLFDSFYRAGSLVFGGGHVVLPLLEGEVVSPGWVSSSSFMIGYGMSNAIPGPLFAFSAYLGTISTIYPNEWLGASICLVAAFLPAFLLVIGIMPFWEKWRTLPKIREIQSGVSAAVVGILIAALYDPVWVNAIFTLKDFALGVISFFLLEVVKLPSWLVVTLVLLFCFVIYYK